MLPFSIPHAAPHDEPFHVRSIFNFFYRRRVKWLLTGIVAYDNVELRETQSPLPDLSCPQVAPPTNWASGESFGRSRRRSAAEPSCCGQVLSHETLGRFFLRRARA
jgi:hypothetical protein